MNDFISTDVPFGNVKGFVLVAVCMNSGDVSVRCALSGAGQPSRCSRRGRTGGTISVCGTAS